MSAETHRSAPDILATIIYAISVIVAVGVTLWLSRAIFMAPGDTVGFLFRVLETQFFPSTLVLLLGLDAIDVRLADQARGGELRFQIEHRGRRV